MKTISLPQNIEFTKGKGQNNSSVSIEPCYPGYGTTLGTAIRRVLLSSLPGAAVIGVKIKGANHEFMALPHIKEDVLELVLNLKQLRIKMHSDETIKLELDAVGEKVVKAGDIKKDSQVEIINPDLVLGHITDMAGSLNMEIYVSKGRGYETIESRGKEEKKEIGYIEMDSVFTPTVAVGMKVENVRVGKMTNWENLILDITTDGTITPEEAFKNSVNILIEQFDSLINQKPAVEAKAEEAVEKEEEIAETDEEQAEKKKRGRPKKTEE